MWTRVAAVVGFLALSAGVGCALLPVAAATPVTDNGSASIAAVYPNPVADGDAGEFVVLQFVESTRLDNWTLSDGEDTVALPHVTTEGRVVLSMAPNRTRNLTAGPVHALGGDLALANGGDSLTLARDGRPVATLSWTDAPEGEIGRPTDGGSPEWRPLGATDFEPRRAGVGRVRPFVLPDAGGLPVRVLASAERRIQLAGYTLTSEAVVAALRNASRRGVSVRVLVDAEPVGGMTRREARLLDDLVSANVSVRVVGGAGARYAFHHAKYAVVDDRALVTTENWKPAGTGGHSSRGWGVVVGQPSVVSGLAETFAADAGGRDAVHWQEFRTSRSFAAAEQSPASGTYPSRFPAESVRAESVQLLVAPDNAERRLVARIESATGSIRVQQVSIGSRQQPLLRATLRAARRGVDVDILLSRAWYVREENRATVRWLNEVAAREDLPLDARLARPRGRYEKVHAKGLVVDQTVVLGSLNWNNNSMRENREVLLVLEGATVTEYYRRVFRADWRGGIWRLPVGLVGVVAIGALLALWVGTRFEFEAPRQGGEEHRMPGPTD